MWNNALRKNLNFRFSRSISIINKIFTLAEKLGTRPNLLSLDPFLIFPNFVWQLVRQHIYVMFISNYRVSFHLWWKKNLVKYQKVSKCYEKYCSYLFSQNAIILRQPPQYLLATLKCLRNPQTQQTDKCKNHIYQLYTSLTFYWLFSFYSLLTILLLEKVLSRVAIKTKK